MDVLNKALAQINDLFKSMTPGARLTAGLLMIVVVISLAYLFNHQMAGGDADCWAGNPSRPAKCRPWKRPLAKPA